MLLLNVAEKVNEISESPWIVVLSLVMGTLAFFLSRFVEKLFYGSSIPKDMSNWIAELDEAVRNLHHADIHKAICYRKLADLISKLPEGFDAVALTGMQVGDNIGRFILEQAENQGFYPKGTFEKLGIMQTPYEHNQEIQQKQVYKSEFPSPIVITEEQPENNNVVPMPWVGQWLGGKLVPTQDKKISNG